MNWGEFFRPGWKKLFLAFVLLVAIMVVSFFAFISALSSAPCEAEGGCSSDELFLKEVLMPGWFIAVFWPLHVVSIITKSSFELTWIGYTLSWAWMTSVAYFISCSVVFGFKKLLRKK